MDQALQVHLLEEKYMVEKSIEKLNHRRDAIMILLNDYSENEVEIVNEQTRVWDDNQRLIDFICHKCGVDPMLLKGKSRKHEMVKCKVIASHFIKKYNPNMSLKKVGAFFGQDHSCVIYWRTLFDNLMFSNKSFKKKFLELEKIILKPE